LYPAHGYIVRRAAEGRKLVNKTIRSNCCPVILLLAFGLLATVAEGKAIFKCTLADGKVTFRDTPCDAQGAAQQQMAGHLATQASPADPERTERRPGKPLDIGGEAGCTNVVVPASKGANSTKAPQKSQAQPGPMTVANACSALVADCFGSGNDPKKSYDGCFKSAARCKTGQPWEEAQACCPESCFAAYSELRKQCLEPHAAAEQALFQEQCVPGASRELEGN
jgi:hypothetical protein